MAVTRNDGNIFEVGSELAVAAPSDALGSYTLVTYALPYIQDSAVNRTANTTDKVKESGTTLTLRSGTSSTWTGTYLQFDGDVAEQVLVTTDNAYATIVKLDSITPESDGKYRFLVMPAARNLGEFNPSLPGGTLPFTYALSTMDVDTDILMTDFDDAAFPVSFTALATCTVLQGHAFAYYRQ